MNRYAASLLVMFLYASLAYMMSSLFGLLFGVDAMGRLFGVCMFSVGALFTTGLNSVGRRLSGAQ